MDQAFCLSCYYVGVKAGYLTLEGPRKETSLKMNAWVGWTLRCERVIFGFFFWNLRALILESIRSSS
jgi:hypothetical protein